MTTLKVPDMTCGHCKATVEAAIHALDQSAAVAVDLAAQTVQIGAARVPTAAILAALQEAGYPATQEA